MYYVATFITLFETTAAPLILLPQTPSREVSDSGGGQAGIISSNSSNNVNNVNKRSSGPAAAAAAVMSIQQPVNKGDIESAIAMPNNNRYGHNRLSEYIWYNLCISKHVL
jgi:hypothetical protein